MRLAYSIGSRHEVPSNIILSVRNTSLKANAAREQSLQFVIRHPGAVSPVNEVISEV